MALIDMGTASAATVGTPTAGNYFLYFDSDNSNKLTRRNSSGNDFVLEGLAATNRIIITNATDFEGVIDSTKEYFIDGIVDMTGVSLEIPSGGAYFTGFNFDLSGFSCSDNSYTMFTSPAGGSGNIIISDLLFDVDGTSSKVFDLTSVSGFEAIEINNVNFNNCTSIGEFNSYRQYFENGTGRFGGSPEIIFSGTMNGIFFENTIARLIDDTWTGSFFAEGTSLSLTGRFLSNCNVELGTLSSFCNFQNSNFANPSSFQLENCQISRDGVIDPTDTNVIPNIDSEDLEAQWRANQGISNTFEGGRLNLTTEIPTIFTGAGTFTTLLGTWTETDLQHFTQPVNGQLRNNGINPREFQVAGFFRVTGGASDDFSVRFRKFKDSDSTTSTVETATARIENNTGGFDTGFVLFNFNVELDQNDYIFTEIANDTDTTTITVLDDSNFTIRRR